MNEKSSKKEHSSTKVLCGSNVSECILMKTIQDKLVEARYRPSGFQYLRIILAVYIIAAHTDLICDRTHGEGFISAVLTLGANIRVPAFFIFSGFLVAASLERSPSLLDFAAKRALRITPPLAVMIFITALVIGPIYTNYSLIDYFYSTDFWRYLLNIIGLMEKDLPGVFATNPDPYDIAGHLWIIQVEIACYALLAILYRTGLYHRAEFMITFGVCVYLVQIANTFLRDAQIHGATPSTAAMCFMTGAIFFRLRRKIAYSRVLLVLSLLGVGGLLIAPAGIRFIALPLTFVTVYFGIYNFPKYWFFPITQYSYGIFLYGLPIQQVLVATDPFFERMLPNFLVATLLAICSGYLSWHLIEKPLLSPRRRERIEKASLNALKAAPD